MKRILLNLVMLLLISSVAWAQERTVTGKVTSSEDGSGLPGVNVIIKGTTTGTVTDIDGNFKLSVPEGAVLQFSAVGLRAADVEIGARSVIDVQLTLDVKQLSEVVVTAAGIEANKAALGYAVQNVKGDEVIQARETNLVNALSSKVAGVTVTASSGSPGASANIRIRGSKSISGSNSPLFVVDGIPIDNSEFGQGVDGVDRSNRAVDINPNDIESLTILKGAAATVLYGIRAANGAVIITTKKGAKGKPVINVSSSFAMDQVNKLPALQNTYAQGRSVGGQLIWRGPETGEGNSWGPLISSLEFDGDTEYPYDKNGRLVPAGSGNGMAAKAYDNLDNFYVNGYTFDNNISVSGGNNSTRYYMSVGNLFQEGVIPNSDFKRTSVKTTITTDITDKLTASISGTFVNSGGNRVQKGSNISGVALTLYRNSPTFDIANGYTNGRDAAADPSTYQLLDGSQRAYRGGIYDSPFWVINKNPFQDDVKRILGYIQLEYKVLPWLTASYKLGMDTYSEKILNVFDINSAALPTGQINVTDRRSLDLNSDFLITANKTVGPVAISATVGHNYYSNEVNGITTQGNELNVAGFYNLSNAIDIITSEGINRRKLFGAFGTVNLGYDEMVFLELSGRNDWSSILPADANSFFYPAASLGFLFTKPLGLESNNIFSYGKLRASWSQVGNDGGASFTYATNSYFSGAGFGGDGFISGGVFPAFGVNAFDRDGLVGNATLRPEKTTTLEFGAEFKFLQDRLNLDVTYYNSLTTDAIIAVDISPSTGFANAVQNAAEISNKGIEVVLGATPVTVGDFSWDLNVNYTQYENVVEKLAPGVETVSLAGFVSTTSRAVAGQPYGAIYGGKFERTDDGQLVIGANGWPLVDDEDGVIGDPNPDWLAGVRNTLSYKGLSFSFLWDIRKGGDVWNGTYGILKTFGMAEITAEQREIKGFVFDGVVNVGTEESPEYVANNVPVDFYDPNLGIGLNKWNRYDFGGLPEENMQDGSWLRLREVTLSYTMPTSWFGDSFVKGVKLGLSGRNLLLFTSYNGIDPETNLTGASNGIGLDYFNNPNTKSFGGSVNITF